MRAQKVSEMEFELRKPNGDVIDNDKMLDLLYKPNNVFSGSQFWGLAQKYYDLVGEVYIYVERGQRGIFDAKSIKGLHLLIPTKVEPHFDENGEPSKFVYKTDTEEIIYQPNEILYIHNPNPQAPLRGQSLLKAGVNAIQTDTQISTYHSRVLENGGKVEGVFKFKTGPLTETQLRDMKKQYNKEYADARKSGKPLFLGGDAEYIKTGLTPDELSFLEAKKMTLEDICILTGVPRSMLASTNDVKFDNADADRKIFLRETVRPLLEMWASVLDGAFFSTEDKDLSAVDPTPENVDQKLKETENGIKNYYMTINEARERHGLDAIDGGDTVMVPFSVMPLGESRSVDTGDTKKRLKAATAHPNQDAEVREMYGKIQVKRMDAREKKFVSELDKYFNGQKKRLVDALEPTQTRRFRKKGLLDEILQLTLEVKIGKDIFMPVITELLKDAGSDAMEYAGSDYAFSVGADITSWVEKRADIFLTQINSTTFETLKQQFEESFAEGESREKLIGRIENTYGDISKKRAGTIARTEVHNATQYGTMEGYRQGGLTIKIWVAVLDDRTRDSHASVDGEERPLDVPFSNGLMFPGDPNASAEEVINCRCVI